MRETVAARSLRERERSGRGGAPSAKHRLLEPRAENGHAKRHDVQEAQPEPDALGVMAGGATVLAAARLDLLLVRLAQVEGVLKQQPTIEGSSYKNEVQLPRQGPARWSINRRLAEDQGSSRGGMT